MRSPALAMFACLAVACTDAVETNQHARMIINGVNAFGESVGFLETRPGFPRATWQGPNGEMIDLGTLPGGSRSSAVAIDDAGTIAGQSETAGGAVHAVRCRGETSAWHRQSRVTPSWARAPLEMGCCTRSVGSTER
jgi:uncharacterized membrane protein